SDPYEWGFRVPLIMISPYIKQQGLIDHTPRSYGAILGFIEDVYGLPRLGTDDGGPNDDLFKDFNFNATPRPFTPISGTVVTPSSCGGSM
ncbi:MAG: hypothetical protein JO043_12230, partial [Candidatus Eremiobacteraeota bacterium]|nr:hypothetical protein [Candidatus Eremiobacteraeota bacterium]